MGVKSLHGNDALHMAVRMKDHYLLYMLLHLGAGKVIKLKQMCGSLKSFSFMNYVIKLQHYIITALYHYIITELQYFTIITP